MHKFLIAVETEDNSGIYEVFDYIYLMPDNTESIKRWTQAAANDHYFMDCSNMENITLEAILLPDGTFSPKEGEVDHAKDNPIRVFALIYDNKIYGLNFVNIGSEKETRYDFAMSSKVIAINGADYPNTNLGDIWDGITFKRPE